MTYQEALEKLKKLFALSGSPEPHEAAAAMRQASKLMEAFSISKEDVAGASVKQEYIRSFWGVSRMPASEAWLINGVAKAFGCMAVWWPSSSYATGMDVYGRYQIIGLEHRLQPAVYIITYTHRLLKNARDRYAAVLKEKGFKDRRILSQKMQSFMEAWTMTVLEQVRQMELSDEEKALLANAAGNTKKGNMKKAAALDAAAVHAGSDAASQVRIHRGVAGNERLLLENR